MEINILCDDCYCSFDIQVSDEYAQLEQDSEIAEVECRNCHKLLSVTWRIKHTFHTRVKTMCPCGAELRYEDHSRVGGPKKYWICDACGKEQMMFGAKFEKLNK